MTGPFRPDELRGPTESDDPAELAAALEAARLLERAVGADGVRPSPDFTSRVMAAVVAQPAPRRSRLGRKSKPNHSVVECRVYLADWQIFEKP